MTSWVKKNISNDGLTFPVFSERWGIRTSLDDQFSHLKSWISLRKFAQRLSIQIPTCSQFFNNVPIFIYVFNLQWLFVHVYIYIIYIYIYILFFLSATRHPRCVFHGSRNLKKFRFAADFFRMLSHERGTSGGVAAPWSKWCRKMPWYCAQNPMGTGNIYIHLP